MGVDLLRVATETTPDPSEDLVKEIDRFVKGKGKVLIVGLLDPDPVMTQVCEREGILVADLSRADQRYRFPSHGRHLTEAGHELVSEILYEFLLEKKLIPGLGGAGQEDRR